MFRYSVDNPANILADPRACKCDVLFQCTSRDCECRAFCHNYLALYKSIDARFTKRCWLTFSPKPPTSQEYFCEQKMSHRETFKRWVEAYLDTSNISRYIAVAEFTQKGQIHYHVYLQFRNKVTFIKQVVNGLYYSGNVLPLYDAPKGGIHYLFKAQELMSSVTDIHKYDSVN